MTSDTRKTKAQLIEELNRLRAKVADDPAHRLFDAAPLPYQSLDGEGRILEVNRAWLDTLGYERAEVEGRFFSEFLTTESQELLRQRFGVFLKQGEVRSVDFTCIKRDGTRILISMDGQVCHDAQGNFQQTHCLLHDITERRQAEEDLALSEQRFRGLFESSADGIAYTDLFGTILNVNQAFCAMLGSKPEDILGKHMLDLTPEEQQEQERAFYQGEVVSQGSGEFEKEYIHADGHRVPASVRVWLNRDENGEPMGAWGIIRDLSGQKVAEKKMAHSQEMYKLLAENTEDVIWVVDNELNYTYLSPSIFSLRGYMPEELLGKGILDSMTEDSRELTVKSYWSLIAQEARGEVEETSRGEVELLHKDGSTVWVDVVIRSLRDQDGERIGFIGSTRDISLQKEMEFQLRDNERSLRALLEATDDTVGLIGLDGTLLTINQNMANVLGGSVSEVLGKNIFDLMPPEVLSKRKAAFLEAVETGKTVKLQDIRGGRIIRSVLYPVSGESGEVTRMALYAEDVTERIQAEESLKRSESQYRRIVETVNEGIIGLDTDQRVTFANQVTADLLGYEIKEILGHQVLEFIAPEEAEEQQAQFERRRQGLHDRYQRRLVRKNGEVVWVLVSSTPIMGEGGDFIGAFAMITNITESKRAEQRLKESEARYRNIFENSVEGLYQSTPEGRFVSVNPALARILGYDSPDDAITSVTDIASQFYADAEARDRLTRTLHEDGVLQDFEVRLKRKDGSSIWISENAREIRDASGNPVMYEGSVVDVTKRRKAEEALLLTQFSVDNAPVDIYWINRDGRLGYVNDSACKSLGFTREEILGLTIPDINPDFRAEDWAGYWSDRRNQGIMRFDAVHQRKDGSRFPVGITSHYKEYGGQEFLFTYAYDLTERENAQKALRRSEDLLNEVQRISLTGGWEIDMTTEAVLWTDGMYQLHGLPVGERSVTLKAFLEELVHPDDRAALADCWNTVITDRVPVELEYRPVMPDGSEAILVGLAIPDVDESGEVWRVFGSTRDVTMERQSALDLQSSHERLLTILDGIDADIYVSGLNNHEILFMNAHMRESFGTPAKGVNCHVAFRDEAEQCEHCSKPFLLDTDGTPLETIVNERYNPLTKRWYLNHDRAIRWLEGELVHMHMAADITDLKTMADDLKVAMAEAEAASLAKNEFLANMSHEIRTPLNGLLGMLQLLQLTSLVEEQRDFLDTAVNSGRNLLQILNDILDLSKVESGKLELEEQHFELGEVLDSVVSVFRHQAESRGLNITWQIDEDLPRHFVSDKGRLRQILFNLVGNAAKFTDTGQITVAAYPLPTLLSDGRVQLFFSVEDTGIGIPDDKLDAIFDPFTQVDGSSTRKYQGTGLGLGIVRRLVMLMDGDVTVVSEEGQGTTVAFTIVVKNSDSLGSILPVGQRRAAFKNLSILVAEDEQVNRVVAKRLLSKLGHDVVCVENGEKALERLRATAFDCILMDIQMPGLDGVETTRVIRDELALDCPIIALTAHAMKGDRKRFLDAGMSGYVAKPFEMADLEEELQRVIAEAQ